MKKKKTKKKSTKTKIIETSTKPIKASISSKSDSFTKTKKKEKKSKKKPIGTCFVLAPFQEPFNTYYNSIIEPAIMKANLQPQRGDSLFLPTPIMGDIWAMIQNAKVIVAILTGKNANVFYELGLGHAIGKSIVLISETMTDVPFDLQALRVILYDKDDPKWGDKLRNAITVSLEATINEPVGAVPTMFRKKVKSQAPEESEISVQISALERSVRALQAKAISSSSFSSSSSSKSSENLLFAFQQEISDRKSSHGLITFEYLIQLSHAAFNNGLSLDTIRRELSKHAESYIVKRVLSEIF